MDAVSRALDRWVEEGLLSRRQAEQLREAEAARTGGRRVPALAEALGYLGASVAAVTAIAIAAQLWPGLSTGWRLALPAVTAAALYAGGSRVRRRDDLAAQRLLGFLWPLSAGAAAMAVLVAARRVVAGLSEREALVAGLAGAQLWVETSSGPGLALGLATAVALFAAGAWTREPVLPGFGVAGTLLFLPQLLGPRLAGGTATLVVLLAAGLALLGGVLVVVGRRPAP